eukprot:scaffold1156_cov394-Prasinococcus_capsulatus_cf.AAC.7
MPDWPRMTCLNPSAGTGRRRLGSLPRRCQRLRALMAATGRFAFALPRSSMEGHLPSPCGGPSMVAPSHQVRP